MKQAIQHRRRMSLERLALCHVAASGRAQAAMVELARDAVTRDDIDSVVIGPTFSETLALSRPLLDLYEQQAHVGVPRPGRAYHPFGAPAQVQAEAR